MKKMLTLALAILLVLSVTVPASAQYRGRHNGNRNHNGPVYYNDGYHGTYVERSVHQTQGLVNGIIGELGYGYGNYYPYRYDYGYDSYDYRHGRHETRNFLLGAAVGVGGTLLIDKLTSNHDSNNAVDNGRAGEEPSKCFERVLKAAKKTGTPVDPTKVMAMCSGQPLQQPEPERMSERASGNVEEDVPPTPAAMTEGFTPAQTATPHPPRGAYRENGLLLNDSDCLLYVLINGVEVGTVIPHRFVTIAKLPPGQLSYHY